MIKIPVAARIVAVAGGAVGVGFGLGWFDAAGTAPPVTVAAARAQWAMPQLPTVDTARDLNLLDGRKPWGATVLEGTDKAAAQAKTGKGTAGTDTGNKAAVDRVDWRLTGVISLDKELWAVVAIKKPDGTYKSELRRVGEQLPDGSRLEAATPDKIEINDEGQRTTVRLFWPRT